MSPSDRGLTPGKGVWSCAASFVLLTAPSSGGYSGGYERRAHKRPTSWKRHGQHEIDQPRAREIQEALLREHYLDGDPTGAWDQRTKDAMQRYQADHGWQTKSLPDSRALITLGLGPRNDNILNPETAATASPSSLALPATAMPSATQQRR